MLSSTLHVQLTDEGMEQLLSDVPEILHSELALKVSHANWRAGCTSS